VIAYCKQLRDDLRAVGYHERTVEVTLDERDLRGGEKNWSWVKKGVPVRVEVGPRDMASSSVFVARRDQPASSKQSLPRAAFVTGIAAMLDEIQQNLLSRARAHVQAHTRTIDDKDEFYSFFTPAGGNTGDEGERQPIHGGFALSHWSGEAEVEAKLKADLGVTLRCIPLEGGGEPGRCPFTGKASQQRVVWAKAY
jgi:prolyl-tRNA synthetase